MENKSVDDLLRHKKEVKKKLAKTLAFSNKKPLLGIFLDNELSTDMETAMKPLLEGLKAVDIEVVILADSNLEALEKNGNILPYGRKNRSNLLAAADMAMVFAFSDIEEMLLNGIIPVSSERPEISDYNPNRETGNSFIYKQNNHWCVFAAMIRAIETFKFPYDWKHIVRQGLLSSENETN